MPRMRSLARGTSCAQVPHITVMVRGVSPGEIATLVIEQCRQTIQSAFPGLT
jgi:hypothetical protein